VQLLLAILVAVAQAAGPWVSCCCVPIRLAATVTSARSGPTPSTCPHCRQAGPAESDCCRPTAPERPPSPQRTPNCCPFGVRSVDALPPTAAHPTARDADAAPAPFATVLPVPSHSSIPLLTAPTDWLRDLPSLTAEAKLFTHHVLRC
jgi:hypothetical protein